MEKPDYRFFTEEKLNNLENELYAVHKKYFIKLNRPCMIYHYTSNIDNLLGILCKRSLYLTDAQFLVDKNELKLGIDNILSVITKNIDLSHKGWRLFCNKFSDVFSGFANIYISSFCLCKDYHYAWKKYANNGQGFCIGFEGSYFNCGDRIYKNKRGLIGEGRVVYNFDEYLIYLFKLIPKINIEFQRGGDYLFHGIITLLTAYLLPIIPLHKNEYPYSNEKEYRMFQFEDRSGLISKNHREWMISPERKIYREKDGIRIPTVCGPKFKQNIIKEIYIGPNCSERDKIERIIKDVLYRNQFSKVRIIKSIQRID